jgi:hypothetical protein
MTVDGRELILEYLCPLAGTITAQLMWIAPWHDVQEAVYVRKKLSPLNPLPWAFMMGNCIGWVTYGILRNNLVCLFVESTAKCVQFHFWCLVSDHSFKITNTRDDANFLSCAMTIG